MNFRIPIFCLAAVALAGCGKPPKPEPKPTPTPVPTATPTPTPSPSPIPTPFAVDKSSRVIVLCYHRFEEKPRDSLAISPAVFESQLQALKDAGITVIPMEDFLAWRRGEKNIPVKSAVISIDDGYLSGYNVAWPILQKFEYPFTMYIYTDYVKGGAKSGGQSMTWEQIVEMSRAGVDIGSHTVSHSALNVRKGKTDEQYREWLTNELRGSKEILESKLGVQVKTLAYPYGLQNEIVREIAMQAGYEAAFTVYGQHLQHGGDPVILGRYALESTKDKAKVFTQAISFSTPSTGSAAQSAAQASVPASAAMLTQPMHNETISDPRPTIKVNLASFGSLDPKTVEMRISGFGIVPATYDPATQLLSYPMHQRLRERDVTVIVNARAGGRKASATWTFHINPDAAPTSMTDSLGTSTPAEAPNDEIGLPLMKPAE